VLDPERVASLGRDVAHGLAAAHRVGVIHRDVRPETIFLTRAGNVRIVDFGLARDEDSNENLTLKGQILGAAEYAAPELALGPAVPASDVYSLGITLYQCLTGELPYGSRSVVRLLTLHSTAPVPWANKVRSEVPRPLAALVRELMAKKPEERPSMADVAFRLAESTVLTSDDLEPDECTGCGADVFVSIDDSSVPICEECVAQVASGKRCGGCLHAITSGFPYAGRTYCSTCIARLQSLSQRPPPEAAP
jgi:serine/threonine-protein kinase